MRRLCLTLLLCLSFALAIVATGFHQSIDHFESLRRYTHPQFTYGNYTFLIGLNDSGGNAGGLSTSVTQKLATPMPWPADHAQKPNVSAGNEFLVDQHQAAGFFYARIDSAPTASQPLDRTARIVVLPYPFVLILSLAYPLYRLIFRRRPRTPAADAFSIPPPHMRLA